MELGIRRFGRRPVRVLLVHGAGSNEDSLAPLGDALATRGIGAVAVSLPGRGGTPGDAPSSVSEAATWLTDVRAQVVPDGGVLLGHSMGGAVAIESALSAPEGLEGIVLVATGARLRVAPAILDRMREAAAHGESAAELQRAVVRPDTPSQVVERLVATESRTPPTTAVRDWEATDRFDRLDDVARISVPALVAGGTEDRLTPPKYARYLADAIPDAELVLLEDAGHWLPVERADEVADAVARFLRGIGGDA